MRISSMRHCAIDFEYNRPSDPGMGLISCCLQAEDGPLYKYWLRDAEDRMLLQMHLNAMRKSHVLVGYEIQLAEARCLAAMGLDPNDWQWRDLLAEWKWLRNETNCHCYGRVVKNNLAYFTVPPKRRTQKRMTEEEVTEADEINRAYLADVQADLEGEEIVAMEEAGYSMLECLYFYEVINLDQYRAAAAEKDSVRGDIILGGADLEANRQRVLDYNAGDIGELFSLSETLTRHMVETLQKPHIIVRTGSVEQCAEEFDVAKIQLNLGEWNARLAKYAHRGIPLDADRLRTFLKIAPELTNEIKLTWNRERPEAPLYRVGLGENMLGKKKSCLTRSPYLEGEYTKDALALQRLISNYCRENGISNWPRTRKGAYATDKKALGTFANGENLIKQLERHSGALSNLKAFSENSDGEIEALRYIGSDSRQRPDFGPHGTQTDRNAHKAKSLIFAMTHWMRALINPPKGRAIVELDFGSEEVFIAAAITDDKVMQNAYLSNDFYVAYAQLTGMYPANLPLPTEEQRSEEWFRPYKKIRQIAKSQCLGMQFGMGGKSLAQSVSNATGEPVEPEQGMEWVRQYRSIYSDYARAVERVKSAYQDGCGICLSNGWRLGPDSPSILSAANYPIQGTGSSILQLACKKIDAEGIEILATMHDSIAAECDEQHAEPVAEEMRRCMIEAATEILGKGGMKVGAPEIVRHGDYWVHGDKAARDWPKYSKYFITTPRERDL